MIERRQSLNEPVLSVRDLVIQYEGAGGVVQAVRGVRFDLAPDESLAVIGESGCGKTTLGLALMGLLPKSARIVAGQILYRTRDGRVTDVVRLSGRELRDFRWKECAMVFQGALNAFNPVLKIWDQVLDTARAHGLRDRTRVREQCERLLRLVQLDPDRVLQSYPHELSGGMRQRVMIALSLLLEPRLVIYDEPTTALDILTQRAIIEVLRSLRQELGFAMVFISHDLPLAAELADRVATMYAGRIVELAPVRDLFYRPRHPYTRGLLRAVPPVSGSLTTVASIPGSPPSLAELPPGCSFAPRCELATDRCRSEDPPLCMVGADHWSACHYWSAVSLDRRTERLGGASHA